MKGSKQSIFLVITWALVAWILTSCKKDVIEKNTSSMSLTNNNQAVLAGYYINHTPATYVVTLSSVANHGEHCTFLLVSSNSPAQFIAPLKLVSGYYHVSVTPEGAYANITTNYIIGGISGSAHEYPLAIKNTYISVNSAGTPSIILK